MIVVDASVVIDLLFRAKGSTAIELELVSGEPLAAPDHMLVETTRGLRRRQLAGVVDRETADDMVTQALDLGIKTHPCEDLISRAWNLRDQFTIDDGLYVALSEALEGRLLTADKRLASQAGRFVEVSVP